jgi:hypothetical protein
MQNKQEGELLLDLRCPPNLLPGSTMSARKARDLVCKHYECYNNERKKESLLRSSRESSQAVVQFIGVSSVISSTDNRQYLP